RYTSLESMADVRPKERNLMKDVKAALRWLLALLVLLPAFAGAQGTREQAPRLEVYVRDGCPHCAAAKEWLATLAGRRPELNIVLRQVDSDPEARADLLRISRQAGYWPPGVPTFVVRERVLVGFDDAEHSGAQLLALIDDGPPAATSVQSEMFGTLSVERL